MNQHLKLQQTNVKKKDKDIAEEMRGANDARKREKLTFKRRELGDLA